MAVRCEFIDVIVVEQLTGGPTLPCAWLEFNAKAGAVHWKGEPTEPVIGREQFQLSGDE